MMVRVLLIASVLIGMAPSPLAAQNCGAAVDTVDRSTDYRSRQLAKPEGHEHNLGYNRDPWNADSTYMLGVESDLQEKNARLVLYDGDGCHIRDLYPLDKFGWRVAWDHEDPGTFYTYAGSDLYLYSIGAGKPQKLKSFAPLTIGNAGVWLNGRGDRILVATSDGAVRSFKLPGLSEERVFKPQVPNGYRVVWEAVRYVGFASYVAVHYTSANSRNHVLDIYADDGELIHRFEGIGEPGQYAFSYEGRMVYYTPWSGERPLEFRAVFIEGGEDTLIHSIPAEQLTHVSNLQIAFPRRVCKWFVVSFFPSAASASIPYAPMRDEIVAIRIEGSMYPLGRSGTAVPPGMPWAQPMAYPNSDGTRISFNSNRARSVDLNILYNPIAY